MKDLKAFLVREQEGGPAARLDAAVMLLGCEAVYVRNKDDLVGYVQSRYPACGVLLRAEDDEVIDILRELRRIGSVLPAFVVAAHPSAAVSSEAVKSNATLIAAESEGELAHAIRSVLSARRERDPAREADVFLGNSREMHEIQAIVARIGPSDFPVLIQGETGTGKEVLARQVHAHSSRAGRMFLKLNCAALPSELVESELFGYDRGAFTGAFQRKLGLFELGDGGTVLLDEIGDMDYKLQAKLLHVLQDHEFWRIGGKDPIAVDVRVIATTHRPLETMIVDGGFRQDLYYRLSVLNVRLPPLRDRRDEILPLADYLLHKHETPNNPAPTMTPEMMFALQNYHWPGNIRELENIIRRFLVLGDPEMIVRELQACTGSTPATPAPPSSTPSLAVLDQVARAKEKAEAEAILAALEAARWNRKRAAAALRVDYKALLYKMKKLAIQQSTPNFALARAAKNSGCE